MTTNEKFFQADTPSPNPRDFLARLTGKVTTVDSVKASDDLIREQSRLVSRGVRLLALIGQCPSDPLAMLQTATRIEILADKDVIPFVIDEGNGNAEFGYAATEWVVDLFRWVVTAPGISALQRNRIAGVLCGYSAEAIRLFEERQSGRLFCSSIE